MQDEHHAASQETLAEALEHLRLARNASRRGDSEGVRYHLGRAEPILQEVVRTEPGETSDAVERGRERARRGVPRRWRTILPWGSDETS